VSTEKLTDDIRSLRSMTWLVEALGAVIGFATVCVAAVVCAFWIDLIWELTGTERVAALIIAGVCGIAYLLFWQWRSARWNSPRHAARILDEAVAGDGLIVSCWELASRPTAFENQLTAGMSQIAISNAAKLSSSVSSSDVVSKRPLKIAGLWLLGVLAVIAVVGAVVPSLADAQWRRFSRPFSDAPPFSVYTFEVVPGNTRVTYNESADITAVIDGGPVERADLVLEREGRAAEIVPMFQQANKTWRTSLVQVTESASYFVRAVDSRSEKFTMEVMTVPEIDSVRVEITPPAHANRRAFDGEFPSNGISGLVGTRVRIRGVSNRPLSAGLVTLRNAAGEQRRVDLEPTADRPTEVSGIFAIKETESLELTLVDTASQTSVDIFKGNVQVIEDRSPYVRLVSPRRSSLATATAALPISVSAEDDFGIESLQLYRSLNHSRPLPIEPELDNVHARLNHRWVLPLENYDLSPGDEIRVFARVEDNDPAGGKGAETEVATVRIISRDEFDKLNRRRAGVQTLSSKYRNARRRLEKLRNELQQIADKFEENDAIDEEAKTDIMKWVEQWNSAADAIEADANKPLPYDLDRNLVEQLKVLARNMRAASGDLQDRLDDEGLTPEQLKKELDDLLERIVQNEEQIQRDAADPIAEFERIFPFRRAQQRFRHLVRWQRDLSERLRPFQNAARLTAREQNRFRDLEVEQRRLRETLIQLLDETEGHAQALPLTQRWNRLRVSTTEFVSAVRESGATDEMSRAEAAIVDQDGNVAVDSAVRAADILASFLETKEREMGEAADEAMEFNPQLKENLGQTLEQMLGEMGPGAPNQGEGSGSGQGMSPSNENIGLYGDTPEMSAAMSAASGDMDTSSAVVVPGGGSSNVDSSSADTSAESSVAAPADAFIPLQFRERIGLYRERILQELNPQ
jgi:hypothetical protein